MGRYESQRAIAARTISERRAAIKGGRKRHSGWLAWIMGRVAALALTLAALLALATLWPRPAPPAPVPAPIAVAPAKFGKTPFLSKIASAAPGNSRAAARRVRPQAGVHGSRLSPTEPGYQVLSPDELAAISQAH